MFVPSILLKQLYTRASLSKTSTGLSFSLKNRLKDATIEKLHWVSLDGEKIPEDKISLQLTHDTFLPAVELNQSDGRPFALRQTITLHLDIEKDACPEKRKLGICFSASPFGKLKFEVEDNITLAGQRSAHIPRDDFDDYGDSIIKTRQQYFESATGNKVNHVGKYSIDPNDLKGNIEHFIGVAQVPIGIAGPLKINGEHAKGEFVVPLATTEGTLVASYNRGMKLLNMSGGVTATVVDDAMQRAPVFIFENARGARDFVKWVQENIEKIREEAEATSSIATVSYTHLTLPTSDLV